MKLFNKTIDKQLFKQYALGSDLSKQEVVAKIFNPQGAQSWFILNSDPEDPDYLWAIVDLGYGAEIGSVSRNELESYRGRFGLGFERDLSFDPINAEELYEGLRRGNNYAKGGNLSRDRKFVNHSENYEVEYSKGKNRAGYGNHSFADGGEVSFIDYKDCEIMYEPHYKKYYANDVEFDSLKEAQEFIDSGEIDPSIRDAYSKGMFADGGSVNVGYNVFNYTDNIYATDEVFKTKALANKFIKEFRSRFSNQGYYRDNRMNKINIQDIDLLAIPSDFNPFKKYADGGDIENFSDNQRMIMNQNVELEHHHEELEDILEDEMPVPAWVVAKMATATQSISDVTHYLDGQKELMEDEDEDEDEDENEDQEAIENKEVVEPINVSAGTKAELTKKFTDDALGNLRGFLKGMEGIDLRDDYTFDYKNEQFEVEPIINSDENSVSNAVFTIFDGDGEEVGEVTYSREGGKQKFTANSEFFSWNNAKFEDGGFMNGVYADGGEISLWKAEPKNKPEKFKTFKSLQDYKAYMTKNAKFFRDEHSKNGTGFYGFEADASQKEVESSIDNLIDSNNQYADGGYFDGTIPNVSTYMSNYAKGGEIAKAEILGFSRNVMGTTDIEMKITGMRKPQDFIVYPIGKDDAVNVITIQSDTRIGQINLVKGVGVMSQSHSNGAYFVHLQMDKLTSFTISESDLEDIKAHVFKTAGANVGTRGIVTDNSGASGVYAKGGMVVTKIEDIPNLTEKVNKGKVTYRGLGMGKLANDFYNLAGTSGTRIKVDGKEYYITDKEFDTFSRGADGKMRVSFDAPARRHEDGGFMNNVYAKGGSVKKDWWHTVVNPNEDFNNFDDKMPIDWEVDDFKSWVVSNSDLDGNVDKEVLDVVKMPKSKLLVEYLNKNGSGKNNNEFYKKYGNWQSALYDIFTQMKKDYLFKKSLKYVLKADIKTVTVKTKNGKEVTYNGADVLNGNYVLAKGGDITSKATYFGKNNVVGVELKDGTTIKPANGYWVKKGAEPIGAEPTPTSSSKSEPKMNTTQIRKDARGNWRAETNVENFNGYDWRISTLKTYTGNLVSSAQGGKTESTGTKGIVMFKYAPYEDPNHTLEVSKPKRLTDKVVSEQHDKALAKFKKFMETGMFKGGGKISNFDKLSDKVAKEYEGKPVKSQYQEEYGKYYSKEEAQEVGDKVAGKVKAMQTDSKAFGGLFSSAKSMVTPKKYPELEGKQVALKTGKFVQVFTQSGSTLSVLELGKVGSGERPYSIDISEVDLTSYEAGGQTSNKKVNSSVETLKKANILAKEIRKDGESWLDAKKRAFAQLKK